MADLPNPETLRKMNVMLVSLIRKEGEPKLVGELLAFLNSHQNKYSQDKRFEGLKAAAYDATLRLETMQTFLGAAVTDEQRAFVLNTASGIVVEAYSALNLAAKNLPLEDKEAYHSLISQGLQELGFKRSYPKLSEFLGGEDRDLMAKFNRLHQLATSIHWKDEDLFTAACPVVVNLPSSGKSVASFF